MNPYDAAADLLVERGWIKGQAEDNEGHLCMIGAMMHALNGALSRAGMYWSQQLDIPTRIIAEQFPDRTRTTSLSPTSHFNDHPDTTLEDVLLVLDKSGRKYDETQ